METSSQNWLRDLRLTAASFIGWSSVASASKPSSPLITKTVQCVLASRNSITRGLDFCNHQSQPLLLEMLWLKPEVVNARISGDTITRKLELVAFQARVIAPFITILQELDNDLPKV